MPRSRVIDATFWEDPDLGRLHSAERLLIAALFSLADASGRINADPRHLRRKVFAYSDFDVTDVQTLLEHALAACPNLAIETIEGVRYVAVHPGPVHAPPARLEWRRMRDKATPRIMERDGYACRMCGAGSNLVIDHIVPIFKGGTNDDDNLQTLCRSCNAIKGEG